MARFQNQPPPHLAYPGFMIQTEREMWQTKWIVSDLEAVRNEEDGKDAIKGKESPFTVSTITEKETQAEEVINSETVI